MKDNEGFNFWREIPEGRSEVLVKFKKDGKIEKLAVTAIVEVENRKASAHYWEGITFEAIEFNPEEYNNLEIIEIQKLKI